MISNTNPALRRCWHPIARSGEIGEQPGRFMLLPVADPAAQAAAGALS